MISTITLRDTVAQSTNLCLAFDHYSRDTRAQTYQSPRKQALHTYSAEPYVPRPLSQNVPRCDPTNLPILPVPQVMGFDPPYGGAGTTFSVHVTDISNDPRQFKFVFGQRKIGAFLERARSDNNTSLLVAQVPRLKDCNWWSSTVPVYLVVADSQTDADLHQVRICDFEFDDSGSPRKRAREDETHGHLQMGSPMKRPNSQPSQPGPVPIYGQSSHVPSHFAPSYQRQVTPSSSSQNLYQSPAPPSVSQNSVQNPRHPPSYSLRESVGQTYPAAPLESGWAEPAVNRDYNAYNRSHDQTQNRYVAEPRDHYFSAARYPEEHSTYREPQGYTGDRAETMHVSPSTASNFYQASVHSSPVTWKSPLRSASSNFYSSSPPPSSTVSKPEISLDSALSFEDPSEITVPMLQRTSTLSSLHSSSATVTTPASTPAGWLPSNKAKLEVLGDLEDMARNWSATEFGHRRRLVRFWRRQEGNVIKVNVRPVEPGSVRSLTDTVISCIYWEERQECFFTSVDAIILLESLVGNKFAVEEKNRIRRNLEGFRPLTVSKGKPDSENFFKLIMAFPAPKPRNIEKDVKAFPWKILTSALRKIISKYSASYEGLRERGVGQDSTQPSSVDRVTPTPSSIDMPPPPPKRDKRTESASPHDEHVSEPITTDLTPDETPQTQQAMPAPAPLVLSSGSPHDVAKLEGTSSPNTRGPLHAGLSIHVPRPASNLPVLEGAVTSTFNNSSSGEQSDRRQSFPPFTGISNIDFSEFFQSPGNPPGTGSGWPSLFPPPSSCMAPDAQFPRK